MATTVMQVGQQCAAPLSLSIPVDPQLEPSIENIKNMKTDLRLLERCSAISAERSSEV